MVRLENRTFRDAERESAKPTALRLPAALLAVTGLSVARLRLLALRDDSKELDEEAMDEDELLKSP